MKIHENHGIPKMREDAEAIFMAGVKAVEPSASVKKYCRINGNEIYFGDSRFDLNKISNIYVIGAGKAGSPMAMAMEDILGSRITKGSVNVKYGYLARPGTITVQEAGHPVPDENGIAGARRVLDLAESAGTDDLVICLISGGGSALLPFPVPGISLQEKQRTIKILMACGAGIHEINTIRKHTSSIKGGRLAVAAYPAPIVSMILSDVVGDNPDVIASGPTVPDGSCFKDCLEIIHKYKLGSKLPENVIRHIELGIAGKVLETPKPGDKVFKTSDNIIIASNLDAMKAATVEAKSRGYKTLVLSSMFEGETRAVADFHTAILKEIRKTGHPVRPPCCIISGGETVVKLSGNGKGGRNQEFVIASALGIKDEDRMVVLSAGTDGTDGPTDAAGGLVDSSTISRAEDAGISAIDYLERNDSYNFLKAIGDLFVTGPTNTNVMDIRVILVS